MWEETTAAVKAVRVAPMEDEGMDDRDDGEDEMGGDSREGGQAEMSTSSFSLPILATFLCPQLPPSVC